MPPIKREQIPVLADLGRAYFDNLHAVAGRHPRRTALHLPTTAGEFAAAFPESAERLLKDLQGGGKTTFFSDADAAYTSSSTSFRFQSINQMLRKGTLPTNLEGYRRIVVKLMMQMAPLPTGQGPLYRAVPRNAISEINALCEKMEKEKEAFRLDPSRGRTFFRDEGFISTSILERSAGHMIMGGEMGVILIITPTVGCRGYCPNSQHRSEHELILAPGTGFTVTGAEIGPLSQGGGKKDGKDKPYYRIKVTAAF